MELHTEGINDSNLGYILSFDTFQYENGTATTLGEGDNKLVDTICTGVCATGSSTESVINATCKELESGPEWVNDKEEILTETMVNTTYQEQCVGECDQPLNSIFTFAPFYKKVLVRTEGGYL